MSDVEALGHGRWWTAAVLLAIATLTMSGSGVAPSIADDTAPAEEVAEQAPADEDATPSEESQQADDGVGEESDTAIELEPADEGEEPPPAKDDAPSGHKKRIIGATTTVLEKQSQLLFRCRVDTGSKSCCMHVEEISITGEQEKWVDNIGKVVRFKVRNRNGETHWLESRIDGYVIIKTSDTRERRYKVPLTLRWKGIEKTVLVTLNNRDGMEYPLLLGRNFLRGDFLVDVEIDSDD